MRGMWAWILASCCVLSCGLVMAQENSPETSRASVCYRNLDYKCVVDVLSDLPKRDPIKITDKQRALDDGRILAVSLLALGEVVQARQVFVWMLRLDRGFVVSGSELRPDFVRVFGEEKAKLGAGYIAQRVVARGQGRSMAMALTEHSVTRAKELAKLPAPEKPIIPEEPSKEVLVSLHLGGAWRLLASRDAEAFGDAAEVVVGAGARFTQGWSLGFDLAWSQHSLILPDLLVPEVLDLTMMHATVWGGYEWRFGALGLRPEFGVGASTVGLRQWIEDVGVGVGARAQARLDLWGPWIVALLIEGRSVSVVQEDAWRTSPVWSGAMLWAFRF